jgi:hypothetical protein
MPATAAAAAVSAAVLFMDAKLTLSGGGKLDATMPLRDSRTDASAGATKRIKVGTCAQGVDGTEQGGWVLGCQDCTCCPAVRDVLQLPGQDSVCCAGQ